MSNYEIKEGQGSMFVNDKKGVENRPDWNGSIKVNGVEMWCSAWKKCTKDGKPWLSLSVKPKEARGEQKPQTLAEKMPQRDQDDPGFGDDTSLPF